MDKTYQVFVAANTASLEGLARNLLKLVGEKVHTERELVDTGLLAAQIVDADLGIGHTTTEARLRVWLVLAIPITIKSTKD